jgi:class 3 adenylate cyclase
VEVLTAKHVKVYLAAMRPETRYARAGDLHIAYEILGDGPIDLISVPEFWNSMEVMWEEPAFERYLTRLASFTRLITFDNRGTGLSDPVPLDQLPLLEHFTDDLRAVMDAAGSERAALISSGGGGMVSALFAATFPARTSALILVNAYARLGQGSDYPWGVPQTDEMLDRMDEGWGEGVLVDVVAPSVASERRFRAWWARYERLGLSPGAALAMRRMLTAADARHALAHIQVPTLVIHRKGNRLVEVGHGRYLAEHIPGARYLEVEGDDHLPFVGDVDTILAEIEEFLTGARSTPEPDRVLATILFTDIVESTPRVVAMGDRRWRDLLATHHQMAMRQVERFAGRVVDFAGDGVMAVFDGPARAIRCALAIREGARQIDLQIRAGVHTGECETHGNAYAGVAVHTAARVAGLATRGTVLVSNTVRDLVAGSGFAFEDRGEHVLKGFDEPRRLFAVVSDL